MPTMAPSAVAILSNVLDWRRDGYSSVSTGNIPVKEPLLWQKILREFFKENLARIIFQLVDHLNELAVKILKLIILSQFTNVRIFTIYYILHMPGKNINWTRDPVGEVYKVEIENYTENNSNKDHHGKKDLICVPNYSSALLFLLHQRPTQPALSHKATHFHLSSQALDNN